MTAAELKESNKVDTGLDPEQPGHEPLLLGYYFDIEGMQDFIDQLCKEQRQLVANELKTWTEDISIPNQYKIDDLCMDAKQPET